MTQHQAANRAANEAASEAAAVEIARLFEVAGGEQETIRQLDGCVARLREAQHARTALTGFSGAQLRAALKLRAQRSRR